MTLSRLARQMDPHLDATAQAGLVRAGEVSPRELVEAAIERIEALNGDLNAVIHPLFEQALETEPADGPFRNPWDTSRSTGGSGGGSGAAVASGMVSIGHANDGGGSIRIPASCCGLVGLKATRGRVSMAPIGDFASGLGTELVVSRSVRDTAALLEWTSAVTPRGEPYFAPAKERPYPEEVGADPGKLRIGLMTTSPGGELETDPDCVTAAEEAG